jgi:hypothetical protein
MSEVFAVGAFVLILLIMGAGFAQPFRKNFWLAVLLLLFFSPILVLWMFVEGVKFIFGFGHGVKKGIDNYNDR